MDITGDDNERMMKIRQSNVEDLQKDVQIKRKKAKDPLQANNGFKLPVIKECL